MKKPKENFLIGQHLQQQPNFSTNLFKLGLTDFRTFGLLQTNMWHWVYVQSLDTIKAQALHQTWEAATHKILFSKEHLVISGWVVLCTKNQSFKQNSCLRCILKPHTDHLRKGEYVLEWVPCEDSLASFPCHCSSWSAQNWVESWWPL
jgi:hypothetical protein